jgi:hypothetical protein
MTRLLRFKDDGHLPGKMLKATIHIQRKDGRTAEDDDIIKFFEDDADRETVLVVYSTPELQKASSFYATIPKAIQYLSDMLKTFRHDADPFEYVQVTTQIHPAVLYHVADLDSADVRHLIEDTVESALRRSIFRIKKD